MVTQRKVIFYMWYLPSGLRIQKASVLPASFTSSRSDGRETTTLVMTMTADGHSHGFHIAPSSCVISNPDSSTARLNISIPFLRIKKLRFREVKSLAEGHTASAPRN